MSNLGALVDAEAGLAAARQTLAKGPVRALRVDGGRFDELSFRRSLAGVREHREVVVPEALRGYRVEHASARDYDRLLPGGAL